MNCARLQSSILCKFYFACKLAVNIIQRSDKARLMNANLFLLSFIMWFVVFFIRVHRIWFNVNNIIIDASTLNICFVIAQMVQYWGFSIKHCYFSLKFIVLLDSEYWQSIRKDGQDQLYITFNSFPIAICIKYSLKKKNIGIELRRRLTLTFTMQKLNNQFQCVCEFFFVYAR